MDTTHDAWESIRKMRLGADRVKEANAERLWREFGELTFKSGETVDDLSIRINTIVGDLHVLGDVVSDPA
jgi:hypothetical protein